MGGLTTDQALAVALAVLLAGAGAALLLAVRSRKLSRRIAIPRIGPLSNVTHVVSGLALIGVAYHVFVYALGLTQFRAPLWAAVLVGVGAILGSIGADAVDSWKSGRGG